MPNELQDLPQTSKLMGAFEKSPKGYIGPKEIGPALQEINVKEAEAKEALGQSDIALEKAKREEAGAIAELKKAFYEKEKKAELAMPERAAAKAARDELAAAKFVPTKDNVQDIAGLFSLMGVVGMVIGKKNALQGMYAMNGMMEGHIKGRKDLFTREAAEFDKQFKILQAKVESASKELEDAMRLRIYDQKAGEEAIAMAVARTESPLIKEMVARLGPQKALNLLEDTKQTLLGMAKTQNDMALKQMEFRQQKELKNIEFEKQKKLKEYELQLLEKKTLTKMGTAGPQRAIYDATGKYVPSPNEAKAIQSAATSLRDINSLRERLKDPDIQTGLRALPAPLITKIKSLAGQDETEVRNFVNKELTGTDKTTLFVKDAILMSFAVEQGLTGSRVPVFTQKVVGPILDPRAYDPNTYDKLLESRQKKLVDVFYDNGFDDNDIAKISRIQPISAAPSKTAETVIVDGKTYSRPANFTDQQWAAYKAEVGAK